MTIKRKKKKNGPNGDKNPPDINRNCYKLKKKKKRTGPVGPEQKPRQSSSNSNSFRGGSSGPGAITSPGLAPPSLQARSYLLRCPSGFPPSSAVLSRCLARPSDRVSAGRLHTATSAPEAVPSSRGRVFRVFPPGQQEKGIFDEPLSRKQTRRTGFKWPPETTLGGETRGWSQKPGAGKPVTDLT